jgi:tetratricopeptide (TPR) repeat protein
MKYYSDQEKLDAQRVKAIESRLARERYNWDAIFEELKDIYRNIPSAGYLNSFEDGENYYYKFWDMSEFFSYCGHAKESDSRKRVVWIENAYPKCCYYMAFICIERGEYNVAMEILEKGIELEPDNPELLSEMGLLLGQAGASTGDTDYFNKAIHFYEKAFNARPFNSDSQKARALRGTGYILVELGDYAKAKEMYEASLTFEESEIAISELQIIAENQR